LDSRQYATAFNQPLSFDTSSVKDMGYMFHSASVLNQPLSFETSSVTTMYGMFRVRSSPCPAPNLQSSPPLHATCTAVARRLPPPGPHLAPHRYPPLDSRQSASAFNQPLSFDTSSVTTMGYMFHSASVLNQPLSFDTSSVTTMYGMFRVRSSPCPAPNLQSSPPLHATCTAVARRLPPPGPHLAPHRYPPLDSRQSASAFNQPLSFDTSSVTSMGYVFYSANSLSAANKLLIRCAWAGTSAFASTGYGSSWGPGSCASQN